MNYGMKVKIYFADGGNLQLNNVTEIHYNYGRINRIPQIKVAFESDIFGTGTTFDMHDEEDRLRPVEFEAINQGVKSKTFNEVPKHMKENWRVA